MTLRKLTLSAVLVALGGWAAAHEFTAGLIVTGPRAPERLADVVNGFLLAADERDGHAEETSDGHLGGVDVQILPLPPEIGTGIKGLYRRRAGSPDVVVVFGNADAPTLPPGALVVEAGALPPEPVWRQGKFASRYRAVYGKPPTRNAAQGYNEARRLDHAIRPLDGLAPAAEFRASIALTARGIDW